MGRQMHVTTGLLLRVQGSAYRLAALVAGSSPFGGLDHATVSNSAAVHFPAAAAPSGQMGLQAGWC